MRLPPGKPRHAPRRAVSRLLRPRDHDSPDTARSVPPAAAPDRGTDRLDPPAARPRPVGAGLLHPQPARPEPGTAGAAPHDWRADPPAGRQFGAEAGRAGSGWSRNTAPASGDPAKLHIGFDAVTGRIVASILTDVDDASQVEPLLDQIAEPVELFLGDGGYDRTGVYTTLDERHPAATVVVPPRADAVLSATADTEPTQRDGHIQAIAGKGRMAWQRDSGYNERAGVEGQFARWKQVIGDGLRFHSDEARVTGSPSRPRSSTECSTLDARTPSASPDQQRGMGVPLPLPSPCNTLARFAEGCESRDGLVARTARAWLQR